MKNEQDLTGMRFGRLIALEDTGERYRTARIWRCLCDCGNEAKVIVYNLINGSVKSCGCLRKERCKDTARLMYERRREMEAGIEMLCIKCRHATNPENKCSWSGLDKAGNPRLQPVEGWETKNKKGKEGGFVVISCPIYEEG